MSNRGRPNRKMNANSIIEILNDMHINDEYFDKLYKQEYCPVIRNFQKFIKNYHQRIADTTENKSLYLYSESEFERLVDKYKSVYYNETEAQINNRLAEYKKQVPVFSSADIEEFQLEVNKLPDSVWTRYKNRLRQQAYKRKNKHSRQIEFSDEAYTQLNILKHSLNAKTWNDLALKLGKDYKQISPIFYLLDTDNLGDALSKIEELLLLKVDNKN